MKILIFTLLLSTTFTHADDLQSVQTINKTLSDSTSILSTATDPTSISKTCVNDLEKKSKLDLLSEVKTFRKSLLNGDLNKDNCEKKLKSLYVDLYRIAPDSFNIEKLKVDATEVMQEIFDAKIALRNSLAKIEETSELKPECVAASRDILRASIFLSEYIGEHFVKILPADKVFEGGSNSLYINPEFGSKLELKSGDILVSRGNAFVSGAIARIGDSDGNFSHVALVYIDPETKKAYTVEAHIEIGVVVAPLEKYLTDGKARSTVFRQPDEKLAHQAAKIMFERAKQASENGENIPYDFGMLLEGKDQKNRPANAELFCSEIAYAGYKEASNGELVLPKYSTGMHMKNTKFKDAIGIKTDITFAPSDMEMDTRFKVVAEWRNLNKVEKSRMTDAIITRLYDYMEKDGYAFSNTTGDIIKRDLAYIGRRLPLFSSLLKEKFPKNMTRSTLGTMIAMDKTAEPILEKLSKANAEHKAQNGFAMTAKEMGEFIDQLKVEDQKTYNTYKAFQKEQLEKNFDEGASPVKAPPKSLFHERFHAK